MDALLHDFLMNSSVVISLIVLVASLFTLSKGADWLVDSAVALSLKWGMPKMVIGATIVSLGTTLPEASECYRLDYCGYGSHYRACCHAWYGAGR